MKIKMGKFKPIISLSFLLCVFLSCKTSSPTSLKAQSNLLSEQKDIRYFTLDKLNQVYTISEDGELNKYNSTDEKLYSYTNRTLGELTLIDVSNPLKIVLFYEHFQTVILLDNTLSFTGQYDLQELGFNDVHSVGLSNDNNLWIFDGTEVKLKKISENGLVLIRSALLSSYLNEELPHRIVEINNYLVLEFENGILLFDNYGQYIKTRLISSISNIQFLKEQFLYFDGKGLHVQYFDGIQQENIIVKGLNIVEPMQMQYRENYIYVLENGAIKRYAVVFN